MKSGRGGGGAITQSVRYDDQIGSYGADLISVLTPTKTGTPPVHSPVFERSTIQNPHAVVILLDIVLSAPPSTLHYDVIKRLNNLAECNRHNQEALSKLGTGFTGLHRRLRSGQIGAEIGEGLLHGA